MRKRVVFAFGASALYASILLAQEQGNRTNDAAGGTQQPVATTSPADDEAVVENFLRLARARQTRRQTALENDARGSDVSQLKQSLRSAAIHKPRPLPGLSSGTLDALEESLLTDASQLLGFLDFRPARVRTLQGAGFDPLAAAVAYVRGQPSLLDLAVLGDIVVLAKPTKVTFEDLGDGFGSTVEISVGEVLAGRAEAGGTIRFRQRSGANERFLSDLEPDDRGSYLFILSQGQYREAAVSNGKQPSGPRSGPSALFTTMSSRFEVAGGTIRPVTPSTIQPMELSALRARLEPLVRFQRANNLNATN